MIIRHFLHLVNIVGIGYRNPVNAGDEIRGVFLMNLVLWTAVAIGGSTLLGTAVGFLLGGVSDKMKDACVAFAAGVMLAAAVFGLFQPAMEMVGGWGCFYPVSGALCGMLFLRVVARLSARINAKGMLHLHPELMFVLAIAVHKFPEGMAGGVGLCGVSTLGCGLVAVGVALQNLPEGAVMIPPMLAAEVKRRQAAVVALLTGLLNAAGVFAGALWGASSGAVLPFTLAFAGGAMIDVIVSQMVPQISSGSFRHGSATLMLGFLLMVVLDVAF